MLARLRPHPHRGEIVAAGVVVLTLFTTVVAARFSTDWADGVRFLFVAIIAAIVVAMAAAPGAGDEVPRPYESVLFVASFLLIFVTLGELARVLGAEALRSSGTIVWVGTLLVGYCAWYSIRRNSAIMTLLGAATAVVVVVAFVDWVFHPHEITTYRWVLLGCAIALTAAAVNRRDAQRRHAVSVIDAVGLTVLALGFTLVLERFFSVFVGLFRPSEPLAGGPAGWELVLLAFGCGLIAYGSVDRERVPAFLGVAVLGFFFVEVALPGREGPSLIGWPIVLLALAGGLLAIGLRPRRELPPEPPVAPPSPPAPPTAPTAVAEP